MTRRGGPLTMLAAAACVFSACAADVAVTAQRSDRIVGEGPATTTPPPPVIAPPPEVTDVPDTLPEAPETTTPRRLPRGEVDLTSIDFGPSKPPRDYDEFLAAVVTDLHEWWAVEYPRLYGSPFEPIAGKIYAAYQDRPDDIPGCGEPGTTPYEDITLYVAFYCGDGDFIVYDDGDGSLLVDLARGYGPATIGTVMAHEFGHAIQQRAGIFDTFRPTIVTEQQADCVAGAWAGRVANGESSLVEFTPDDVRAGVIAMTTVSDPTGTNQFEPGGHGSAFDRVGAFQVGFIEGLERCVQLIDDPLPLVPNEFTEADFETGGNAAFGYGDDDLMGFLVEDLNVYWADELDARVPGLDHLELVVLQSANEHGCADLRGSLEHGVALCVSTGQVLFYERGARLLYDAFGDFSVGYLLGTAWSEAVMSALGSDLTGTERALAGDCLTGGWVKSVTPVDFALPQPRLESREVTVSAGDLDEAIQTLLLIADERGDMSQVGSAFDKIDALRQGVINGTDFCLARL